MYATKHKTLNKLYRDGRSPYLKAVNGLNRTNRYAHGETIGPCEIEIYAPAFSTYRLLASTVGHELIHALHNFNPFFKQRWMNENKQKFEFGTQISINDARMYSEYIAYSWEYKYSGRGFNGMQLYEGSSTKMINLFGTYD